MQRKIKAKTGRKGKRKPSGKAARPVSLDQVENIFLVTGIGGSAGGVEALRQFFQHAPKDSGIAYIVAQHLSPDRKSMLTSILSQSAKIPVVDIREGEPIVRDRVYVLTPGLVVTIEKLRFRLAPAAERPRAIRSTACSSRSARSSVRVPPPWSFRDSAMTALAVSGRSASMAD
jgi:chemotaxis response regulator CheB